MNKDLYRGILPSTNVRGMRIASLKSVPSSHLIPRAGDMSPLNKKTQKILVIEDDPDILNALNIVLGSVGFEVDVMLSGKHIFLNQFSVPDLFILDKRLPDVDGLDICRYLKSKPNYSGVPIIIISASPKVKNKAFECGASAFLEKPFSMQELVNSIKAMLRTPEDKGV